MAKLIYVISDKRTKKGYRENVIQITVFEDVQEISVKLKKLINKKKLLSVKIEGNGECFLYVDEKDFEKMFIDLKNIEQYIFEEEKKYAYLNALAEVYEEYPDEEGDIEEYLNDSSATNILEIIHILDRYMRKELNDTIYRYMEYKYVPEKTYVCEIWTNYPGNHKIIQIIDLNKRIYIYSIKYDIRDQKSYEKYKEQVECIRLNGIEDFLSSYPNALDIGNEDCVIREYFF